MMDYKPHVAMFLAQFAYAGMALFSKAAIDKGMNPFVFVVYRQAFASIALAPLAIFLESNQAPPLSSRLLRKVFLISLCGLTASLNLYYVAIYYTSATFAAATTNIIPALTFLLAVMLRMETISIKHSHGVAKVVGAAIGFSGVLVFAFVKGPPFKFINWYQPNIDQNIEDSLKGCCSKDWIKGSLLMITSHILWSLWFVLQGPIAEEYPSKLRLTTLQCFFCCIQSAFWAIVVERNPSAWKIGWDVHLLAVAYCGITVTGVCYWVQVWTIKRKGSVFTSMFTPLAFIITVIFSAFLWKETLNWGSVGGATLMVGGLYSLLWGMNNEETIKAINEGITETNITLTTLHITR